MQTRFCICFILGILAASGCGSSSNVPSFDASISIQSPPVIKRVDPTSGKAGDTITIFGFGFSSGATNNTIIVGGKTTTANSYALINVPTNGEIESLTFKVPTGASVGTGGISVTAFENTSNNDFQFSVNP